MKINRIFFFGKDLPKLSSAPMCVTKIRVKTVKV